VTGPTELAVTTVALLTTVGSSRDEARPAGSVAAFFSSVAFFTSAACNIPSELPSLPYHVLCIIFAFMHLIHVTFGFYQIAFSFMYHLFFFCLLGFLPLSCSLYITCDVPSKAKPSP
jgi:hypothetical protein